MYNQFNYISFAALYLHQNDTPHNCYVNVPSRWIFCHLMWIREHFNINNTSLSYNWIQWSIWKYFCIWYLLSFSLSMRWCYDRMDSNFMRCALSHLAWVWKIIISENCSLYLLHVRLLHTYKNVKRLNEINYNGLTSQWHCDHAYG